MNKKYQKFLIISTIFFLVGGVYIYSSNSLRTGNIIPVAFGSALESSVVPETPVSASNVSQDVSSDVAFLESLVSLKNIKMDVSFFDKASYKALNNNAVKIELVQTNTGRVNPFAPMSSNAAINVSTAKSVTTDEPTQITDKTAVLNGTVDTMGIITDTYFEYGTSEQGTSNIIAIGKLSLVGTFVKNVLGLNSKTTYYYKACAKINNIANCGDLVSFTTN